jgi:lipopolysaccharide transport system permease protein
VFHYLKHIVMLSVTKRDTKLASTMDKPIILEAGRSERHYWLDLWRYRELFAVLAWRDLAVRYKQTVIGVAWALIRPLLTMIVFTFVFGRIAKLPSDGGVPYALMVAAGMIPWSFFATGLAEASNSLVVNSNLISKVYFPRMLVPAATIVVAFVDFAISFFMVILLWFWYHYGPDWQLVFLPLFVVLAFAVTLGPSLWLTAFNVKYRDFRYVIPFLVQFGLYVSPVGFSSSVIPNSWKLIYAINPMVGVIDGFRWCLLGGHSPLDLSQLSISVAVTLLLLYLGIREFRRTESSFADMI